METQAEILNKVVVPQEYIDQIIYLEQEITDNKFAIGDILVALVDTFEGRKQEVCEYLQGATSFDWKTLSDYETTSRRWPKHLRDRYASVAYSLFRNLDPNSPEDIAYMDQAVDNQMTANRVLDMKYDRNSPRYILRNVLRQLQKIDDEDPDIEVIVGLVTEKLNELELFAQ